MPLPVPPLSGSPARLVASLRAWPVADAGRCPCLQLPAQRSGVARHVEISDDDTPRCAADGFTCRPSACAGGGQRAASLVPLRRSTLAALYPHRRGKRSCRPTLSPGHRRTRTSPSRLIYHRLMRTASPPHPQAVDDCSHPPAESGLTPALIERCGQYRFARRPQPARGFGGASAMRIAPSASR